MTERTRVKIYGDGNADSPERANKTFLHLGNQRLPLDFRIGPLDVQRLLSKWHIPICELQCQCREDRLDVTPVLVVPRTKGTCAMFPLCENDLGKGLADGQFSGLRDR